MRLTSSSLGGEGGPPRHAWVVVVIVAALGSVFALDRSTGDAPVQHLYYVPIIVAALAYGTRGGLAAALCAVVLYHLANGLLPRAGHGEADAVQTLLFLAVGVVTAKLAGDAERLRRLASTDDLTGLHNLRSFEARLGDLLRVARRAGTPLALLVLDVDRLKALNDRFGHLAGAEAVRMVGRVLADELPRAAVACRYGGDEFVVALPGCDGARAEAIALALARSVNALAPRLAGHALPAGTLSISVGVAARDFSAPAPPGAGDGGEALFSAADAALYRAKADGRNLIRSAPEPGGRADQYAAPAVRDDGDTAASVETAVTASVPPSGPTRSTAHSPLRAQIRPVRSGDRRS